MNRKRRTGPPPSPTSLFPRQKAGFLEGTKERPHGSRIIGRWRTCLQREHNAAPDADITDGRLEITSMTTKETAPVHPGETLVEEFLKAMNLCQNRSALEFPPPPDASMKEPPGNGGLRPAPLSGRLTISRPRPNSGWESEGNTTWMLRQMHWAKNAHREHWNTLPHTRPTKAGLHRPDGLKVMGERLFQRTDRFPVDLAPEPSGQCSSDGIADVQERRARRIRLLTAENDIEMIV